VTRQTLEKDRMLFGDDEVGERRQGPAKEQAAVSSRLY
jgi:hypothetical protein